MDLCICFFIKGTKVDCDFARLSGINVNQANNRGQTALILAAESDDGGGVIDDYEIFVRLLFCCLTQGS